MSALLNLFLAISWALIITVLVLAFIGPAPEQTRNKKDEDNG